VSAATKTVCLLGLPFDRGSTFLQGPALAPPIIRKALASDSSNLWTEDGHDLGAAHALHDLGDLVLPEEGHKALPLIENAVSNALAAGQPLICLGGDHSVTYPILRGFRSHHADLTILHFDAHPDLYDELNGELSHACPFARIMGNGLARRLVQVGIRTINQHQLDQARRFGVEIISMRHREQLAALQLEGPLYVSLDLDVLDPAFVPGISHYEPGGMSVRDVLDVIQAVRVPIVGADIVEFNPTRDRDGQTAMVCAKFLKEIAAAMLRGGGATRTDWV
jgi:agmatinase